MDERCAEQGDHGQNGSGDDIEHEVMSGDHDDEDRDEWMQDSYGTKEP